MSTFEVQEKSGALFRNTKKTEDKQPDYRGNVKIGGNLYTLAGWLKDGKNGKFLSLKVESTELNHKSPTPAAVKSTAATQEEQSDDLPF
jgi:uncharacterized protein (DUF736 family)